MKLKRKNPKVECPFCARQVRLTTRGYINSHLDNTDKPCKGKGLTLYGAELYLKKMRGQT